MAEQPSSVWLTGQVQSGHQRRGRYLPASMAHPGKMLPAIAAHAIATYTAPGDLVLDPMCGIGTTLVEAVYLGRRAIGIEYEPHWAELASANLAHAADQGAAGTGEVWCADARRLPALLPPELRGTASLVLTSPPYGPSVHGQVNAPGVEGGKVAKRDDRYSRDAANLAHRNPDELAEGFARILTGSAALLRPAGHVLVTARPYRHHGELVDIPGMVLAAGQAAGLEPVERLVALLAGIRDGRLVPRASFFQINNVRAARAAGDPQWIPGHEDLLVFRTTTR